MAWFSEKSNLREIAPGVLSQLWDEFVDAWYNDLQVLVDAPTAEYAISAANGYLKYYGSGTTIVDVNWDEANHCFLWDVRSSQPVN